MFRSTVNVERQSLHHHPARRVGITGDHRSPERARPIMLDLELGLAHLDPTFVERLRHFAPDPRSLAGPVRS